MASLMGGDNLNAEAVGGLQQTRRRGDTETRRHRAASRRHSALRTLDKSLGSPRSRGFHSASRNPHSAIRNGFTLIELLVVITILVILTALTITAVNFSMTAERIRAGARQMQSYLEGARDRAIFAGEPRGVRFLVDQTNNHTVTSMVYVGPAKPWNQGIIQLERKDDVTNGTGPPPVPPPDGIADDAEIWLVRGFRAGWMNLYNRQLLVDGTRIKIPGDANGSWYTITTARLTTDDDGNPDTDVLELTVPFRDPGTSLTTDDVIAFLGGGPNTYQMELPPAPLQGVDPTLLPNGIVIDLDRSRLPPSWQVGGGYSGQMDIMFSPRGTVVGREAANGIIHFYLAEAAVAEQLELLVQAGSWNREDIPTGPDLPTTPPLPVGDRIVATLFTRTGAISTHQIDPRDGDPVGPPIVPADGILDDPFFFAETGEVAGE